MKKYTTLAAFAALATSAGAAVLATDVAFTSNPENGWAHGFNDTTTGGGNDVGNDVNFGLAALGDTSGDRWSGDGTTSTAFPPNALMLVNLGGGGTAGDHWDGGSITWDTGVAYHTWGRSTDVDGANGHNGADTIYSSYTVTATGSYDIVGAWTENGNSGGATIAVLINGTSLGGDTIDLDSAGDSATIQSLAHSLTAGDIVSFRTLRDTDVTSGGSAALAASVTAVPEPASSALLGLGGLALILRRRK
jgi:hypothetical protein